MRNFFIFVFEVIKVVIISLAVIIPVRYFLIQPFYVKGASMEPSFYDHEYLIIDEITYRFRKPERGEIIVFLSPINRDHYLKRVIGLPGERIRVENNKVIVYNVEYPEGAVVEENYLGESTPGSSNYTLGNGQYFVMGDNRDASFDSRRFGPIDDSVIIGRVWFRGWPFTRVSTFSPPSYNL